MSYKHQRRLYVVLFIVIGTGIAAGLILYALSSNINLFYTPSQLAEEQKLPLKTIRVGGMVMANSFHTDTQLNNTFEITDYQSRLKVSYQGILPDLFKEGQGVVVLGKVDKPGHFKATQVLAKHDENYMPPEIRALKS
jgi:cytochrome c-type biogenesis protein CcmE